MELNAFSLDFYKFLLSSPKYTHIIEMNFTRLCHQMDFCFAFTAKAATAHEVAWSNKSQTAEKGNNKSKIVL